MVRISVCKSEKEREKVLKKIVQACHPNWYRSTYESTTEVFVIPAPPVDFDRKGLTSERKQTWLNRFRHVTPYLPPGVIEKHLYRLEKIAFSGKEYETSKTKNTRLDPVPQKVPLLPYANPPVRRKRKLEQNLEQNK